jgi:hypothetical protein
MVIIAVHLRMTASAVTPLGHFAHVDILSRVSNAPQAFKHHNCKNLELEINLLCSGIVAQTQETYQSVMWSSQLCSYLDTYGM